MMIHRIKSKEVRKLRNKFWLLFTTILATIIIAALFFIYYWVSFNMETEWNSWLHSSSFANEISSGDIPTYGRNYFIVALNEERGKAIVYSTLEMENEHYEQLVEMTLNASSRVTVNVSGWQQIIDEAQPRYLPMNDRKWVTVFIDAPQPLKLEVAHRFNFTEPLWGIDSNEILLVFVDMTNSIDDLTSIQLVLSKIGIIMIVVTAGISFILIHFLTKPLAQSFEQQKQFIADASHELKTPLSIIRNNFGVLLANRKETVESQMEWLRYMEFGFERMTTLTQDLLTLARLESSDIKLEKEVFDLSEASEAIVQVLSAKMIEKELSFTSKIESNLLINQNREKIMQVVTILLDNAIKYADEKGWVELEIKKSHHRFHIIVKNSGPGIHSNQMSRIFERFYCGDSSRNSQSGSYGLGLAIAKEIIKKSKGKIQVSSIENEVTTFHVKL